MLQGFKLRFVPQIENGSKGFTLRNKPKRTPKIGETLYQYTGLRTNNCKLITKMHTLKGIEEVYLLISFNKVTIWLNGKLLNIDEKMQFYVLDGFKDEADFIDYWQTEYKSSEIEDSVQMFRWVELPF